MGRAAELESLAAALADARAGRGRLVLVSGPPGIGKTRIVEEALAQAGLPSSRTLWGRCPDQPDLPPFWPWRRPLRAAAALLDDDTLRATCAGAERRIASILPSLRVRLGVAAADADGGPAPEAGAEERLLLLEALCELLLGASMKPDARGGARPGSEAGAPLVVALDDVHWADSGSLDLLALLGPELATLPLLVVATHRDAEMRRLPQATGNLARVSERIALTGLEGREVAAFVRAASGAEPAPGTVATLARATAGNPFFLGELVRVLGDGDGVERDALPALPETVRDVIRRHLSLLGDDERGLLCLASVIGHEIELSVLQAASGESLLALLERLAAAVRAGVLVELRDDVRRWRFAHALIPETLYADLAPSVRVQAHRQVATALERVYGALPDPPVTQLAHHWFRATPLGGAERAAEWSERAARSAYEAGSWEEAASHVRRALQALATCAPDEARRQALLLSLGLAEGKAGHLDAAREAFESAARLAEERGDAGGLARAALEHARLEVGLVVNPRVVSILERAERALPPGPSYDRCAVLAELSNALIFSGDRERREELSHQSVAMARALGDPSALVASLLAEHFVRWGPDTSPQDLLALIDEAYGLLPQVPAKRLVLETHRWRVCRLLELGDVAAATRAVEELERLTDRWRMRGYAVYARLTRGTLQLIAGRLDDAARAADEAFDARLGDSLSTIAASVEALRLTVLIERDDLERYRPALDGLEALTRSVPAWRAPAALVTAELGEVDRARRALATSAAQRFSDQPRDGTWLHSLAMWAQVTWGLRDAGAASALRPLLEPQAERHVVVGVAVAGSGSCHWHLGLLAETLGDFEGAIAHHGRAIASNERAGAALFAARARLGLARSLAQRRAEGDAARAVALCEEVRRDADRMGWTRLLRHLADAEAAGLFERGANPSANGAREAAVRPDGGERPIAREASTVATTPPAVASLRRSGDAWLVSHAGRSFHLKDAKGLAYLAELLVSPGREVHALDLVRAGEGAPESGAPRAGGARQLQESGLSAADLGDAGELLDAEARSAYRARAEDLREELAEAERFGDAGRAERAREELEFLAAELARATGLGGRARRAGGAAERARVNVTRSIGAVLRKISAADPVLGDHLAASIRTGVFCSYQPQAGHPLRWEL